jgi:chromosome segregation ATPase
VEEKLIKLGLDAYKVGGIIGLLVFLIAVLIFLLMTYYARRVKSQATEIIGARSEVDRMRDRMTKQLEDLLEDCEKKCGRKDGLVEEYRQTIENLRREVSVYKANENWFTNEISNLEQRIREMASELSKTGKGSPRRRRP